MGTCSVPHCSINHGAQIISGATGTGRPGLRESARRRVSYLVRLPINASGKTCSPFGSGGGCAHAGGSTNGSASTGEQQHCQAPEGEQRQHGFAEGASVYDQSHHGNCRGYGIILAPAQQGDAEDAPPRWQVKFERGQRATTIAEPYLSLSHIHHHHRVAPAACNQRIVVMVGPHKGKEGITVSKCGDKWTCQLDGAEQKENFASERLHALEDPDWGTAYEQFDPCLVEAEVPLEQIPGWVHGYCSQPGRPVRLTRQKPDAGLWFSVLTKQRTIDSLTDTEVQGLKYLLTEAGDEADVASMRVRLQRKADSSWTITYKCARAVKCGCPFELQLRHASGSASVEVWEMEKHQGHDPASAAERAQLKMDPEVQLLVETLLRCGVKPYRVWCQVHMQQLSTEAAAGGSLEAASDARFSITLQQVYAVQKQIQRAEGYNLTSDAAAVAAQIAELSKLGYVRFFQPLKERCDGTSTTSDGQPVVTVLGEDGMHQPLIIILQTPFQQRMLGEFGGRVTLMDATGGTNKYGYPVYSATVADEDGRGVPVGFMICSSDTTEVVEKFLRALQEGARAGGAPGFKYGYILIDKSKQEMAAVKQLVLTGDAENFLLCYFHFLQEWERFLRSSESGVSAKGMQHRALIELKQLAKMRDRALFEEKLNEFYTIFAQYPKVVANMKKNWAGVAEHWAWWGRLAILDLAIHTTNLLERGWGIFKYVHLDRNTQSTIQKLVDVLLGVWVPATMQQRALQLAGRATSDQRRQVQRVDDIVADLVASGGVEQLHIAGTPGLTSIKKASGRGDIKAVLGDLSCMCRFSADAVCLHLRAAAQVVGFTPKLRAATAAHLVEYGLIRVDEATGICNCCTLADPLKPVIFRPQDGSCTCHDHVLHGTCCHLLAAAQLPALAGVQVLTGAGGVEEETSEERLDIGKHRTFQQPRREPLGEDWGRAEMAALVRAPQATAGAIRHVLSNADPAMAQLRSDTAGFQRSCAALPEGEEKQGLLQQMAELRKKADAAVAAAQLPRTKVRERKVQRRQQGRPEGQRKVTALFKSRTSGSKRSLAQELDGEYGDEFKPQGKKGRTSNKVRGVTIEGNVNGTTLRTGAHRRYQSRQGAGAGGRAGSAAGSMQAGKALQHPSIPHQ